ncbi:STAS/SEC14 domain-containing protein [Alkalihalobacillus sp. LMS39]|uniref:STAS/SEC14 domain-containing protein n=1 Tax=Alkalihalobacillus sp. LMS39 TaxID=2924032 RepID=UPI001FB4611C|nr:STAS/SEC14 domain-containing protein [Alkalihalobacillus sp. LMS39]UOE94919.1 STAS/SEC14 domain-containing protein [Alkalihalobacillus sp. LMS39]
MWNVQVEDRTKKIIAIQWSGKVTPEDIEAANTKLEKEITSLHTNEFDVIVDMVDVSVMIPESQKKLVDHQQWLLQKGMKRAAVIVNGTIAKLQLKRTARESSHQNEFHFETFEEALTFLKG